MPGYDPVRDPNPSPSRELPEEPQPQPLAPPQQQQQQQNGAEGSSSPIRTRASIADLLNPSPSERPGTALRRTPSGSGYQESAAFATGGSLGGSWQESAVSPTTRLATLPPPSASAASAGSIPTPGSTSSNPFDRYHQVPHHTREERSPSLQNILQGGEAGPIHRERGRSASVASGADVSEPSIRVAPSGGSTGAGGQGGASSSSSSHAPFRTLLDGATADSISPSHSAQSVQTSEDGSQARQTTADGFAIPGIPVRSSPDTRLEHRSLPSKSPLSNAESIVPAASSSRLPFGIPSIPSTPQGAEAARPITPASPASSSMEAPASSVPATPTEGTAGGSSSATGLTKAEAAAKKRAAAAERRKSSLSAGNRRKLSAIVGNEEDLVPVSEVRLGAAAKAAADNEASSAQPKAKRAKMDEAAAGSANGLATPPKEVPAPARSGLPVPLSGTPVNARPGATASTSTYAPKSPELGHAALPPKPEEPPSVVDEKPYSPPPAEPQQQQQQQYLSARPYAPKARVSHGRSVMQPITNAEIEMLKKMHKNPLRSAVESKEGVAHSNGAEIEKAGQVAEHYNRRDDVGVEGREQSKIFPLRKYNNWVKSVLIGRFARSRPASDADQGRARPLGPRVMELGCGKGGDLAKWDKARASQLLMVDIAAVSVEHAKARYLGKRHSFHAEFFAFDCFDIPLAEKLPKELLEPGFDNVSLQFCMHYAWSDVPKVRVLLENISKYLRQGGVFIGTIPDGDKLRERLKALPGDELKFGNDIYSIEFEQKQTMALFGHKYEFFLADAVENVPEFVVDWTQLESLAFEYGMKCVYRKNFLDVYEAEKSHPDFGPLMERMGVVNRMTKQPTLDEQMWEAASIYQAFAFEKFRD